MNLNEAFHFLYCTFGSHKKASEFLGITKEHYSGIRHRRVPIPERTAEYIIMKAKEAAKGRIAEAQAEVSV